MSTNYRHDQEAPVISSNSNSYHLVGESASSPIVLSASEGEALIVPGVDALLRAEFSRVG